jgi:hypothetical protein
MIPAPGANVNRHGRADPPAGPSPSGSVLTKKLLVRPRELA